MSPDPLISIVDDDDSLRVAMVGLVRSLGYRASGHPTAEAFLASGEVAAASCVITDLQMPGMGGIGLKRALDAGDVHVPVIMITARTESVLLESARESGALCLLRKPVETDALIDCINRALAA
ncbi:response regulator transcription factor [Thalassobaculum sp.]|uniref:response regulator transcription factor n=1 Tax=Thalassobaculum sp. TaxID=2022740 RepID=UPI003B5B517B